MKKLKIIIIVILGTAFCAISTLRILQYINYKNRRKISKEQQVLLNEVIKMQHALKNSNDTLLFNIFNPTFIREVNIQKFKSALNKWRNGRKVKRIKIQRFMIFGRGGHVTSWITFDSKEKVFLYQSWINTSAGWKLMWLTKVLPHNLSYGTRDEKQIQKLKQLTLQELIVNRNITRINRDLPIPETLVVVLPKGTKKSIFRIPGHVIKQLPREEIKANVLKLHAYYYLEFATIRILDDIATSYIDIYPLYANVPGLNRVRGLQLFFIRKNNQWEFDHQGTKW